MPDAVRSGLRMRKFGGPPPAAALDPAPLLVLRQTLTGLEDVTGKIAARGSRRLRLLRLRRHPRRPLALARRLHLCRRHAQGRHREVPRPDPQWLQARPRYGVRPDRSRRLPGRGRDLPGGRPRGRELHSGPLPGLPDALGLRPPPEPRLALRGDRDLEARPSRFLRDPPRPVHRELGQALLRLRHGQQPRLHRALLGARVAAAARLPGQPGHGRLRPHARHRHPDERMVGRRPTPSSATPGPSARSAAPPTSWAGSGRCPRPTAPAAGT